MTVNDIVISALLLLCFLDLAQTFSTVQVFNIPTQELQALQDLYISTHGDLWSFKSNYTKYGMPWNFSEPDPNPCIQHWQGIACTSTCMNTPCLIEEIVLQSYNLVGSIPRSIGNLSAMTYLNLASNHLSGTIPAEIGSLSNVYTLYLNSNQLHRSIPPAIGNCVSLAYLYLGGNLLQYHIPSSIGNMTSLTYLDLNTNQLSGSIPEEITQLTSLQYLYLYSNLLEGTIPNKIGNLISLQKVYMDYNHLQGSIPSSIGNITSLKTLNVIHNELTGSLPDSLCQLLALVSFEITGNYLHGTIPDQIGALTQLTTLTLDANQLTGTIPSSLGNCIKLQYLYLFSNALHGTIPSTLGQLAVVQYALFKNNFLTGPIPSSLGNCVDLVYVQFDYNLLTGSLSPSFGNWSDMSYFSAEYNNLNGTIPSSFQGMTNIYIFYIYNNYISGTLPSSLGNWKYLDVISINNNELTGTLPPSIGNWTYITEFYGYANYFTGSFPEQISNWKWLQYFEFGDNMISGSLPSGMSDMIYLQALFIYRNRITGRLPEFDTLPYLNSSIVYDNQLSGTMPVSFANSSYFSVVDIQTNQFSGSIPIQYQQLQYVQNCFFETNYLTGNLQFLSTWTTLSNMNISTNYFTGEIASIFSNLSHLIQMDLSQNHLSGTLNDCFQYMTNLTLLVLHSNLFVGNLEGLVDFSIQKQLSTIDVSDNQLSGSIPSNLFVTQSAVTSLIAFAAVKNCFTGSIPDTFCQCTRLETIALDGLHTAEHCEKKFFPGIPEIRSYQLNRYVEGSIPDCIFAMPHLRTLHLSGNGMIGSLPDVNYDHMLNGLKDLSLSYNQFTGTIPVSMQQKIWNNLDLSFNKLDGVLSNDFGDYSSADNSSSLTLIVNRLSGSIPSSILNMLHINILEGNLFSCSKGNKVWDLPSNDNHAASYICGSDTVNVSMYVWIGSVGTMLIVLMGLSWWMGYVKRARDWWKMGKIVIEMLVSTELFPLSPLNQGSVFDHEDQRRLEKDEVKDMKNKIVDGKDSQQSVNYEQGFGHSTAIQQVYALVGKSLHSIRMMSVWIAIFALVILLPSYGILSIYYSSHRYTYAWTISLGYFSGIIPAVYLFVCLTLFYICLTSHLCNQWIHNKYDKNQKALTSGKSHQERQVAIGKESKIEEGFHVMNEKEKTSREVEVASSTQDPLNKSKGMESTLSKESYWKTRFKDITFPVVQIYCHNALLQAAIFVLNVVIVMSVNVGYVYTTTLNLSSETMIWIVLSVSIFKIVWGNVVVLKVFGSQLKALWKKIPTATESPSSFVTMAGSNEESVYRVQTLAHLIIFNNILAPFLAEAFADPSCFYYVIQSPPSVSVTYSSVQCQTYASVEEQNVCLAEVLIQRLVSYTPPFIYSFQCSSTLLTAFATIFVYRYLFSGLLGPLGTFWIRWYKEMLAKRLENNDQNRSLQYHSSHLEDAMNEGNVEVPNPLVIEMAERPSMKMIKTAVLLKQNEDESVKSTVGPQVKTFPTANISSTPPLLKQYSSPPSQNTCSLESLYWIAAKYFSKIAGNDMVFNQESFVITMIGDLAVLVTFGLVFPPLALIICFSIAMNTWTHQLLLRQYLISFTSTSSSRLWKKLENQHSNLLELFWPLVPSLALLSACFVGFFLFDILGDQVGVLNGMWILLVTAAIPVLVWIAERVFLVFYVVE